MWFYDGETSLANIDHATPPRIGDHVFLGPTGTWRVVGVWWQYPDPGSLAYQHGDRGAIVTVQCLPGDLPFATAEETTQP
jgi:hypothetical protein